MPAIRDSAVPSLQSGVRMVRDEVRHCWVLLAPERVVQLDEVAWEVIVRVKGEMTVAEIVDELTEDFDARRETIQQDVHQLFADLVAENLVRL